MPRGTYFRFNPVGSEYDCDIDEQSEERMILMAITTELWLKKEEQYSKVLELLDIIDPSTKHTEIKTIPPSVEM
jgi:hypothetical protein